MLAAHLTRSAKSARLLLEVAVEKGMTSAAVLRGTRLTMQLLDDPSAEIATGQEERLIGNLVAAFPDEPGIGLDAGARYTVASFGMLGFATLTSPTLRDSLGIALRYQDLGFTLARARLVEERDFSFVELDASHLAPEIQRFVVDHQIATFWAAFPTIAGTPPVPQLDFVFPPPADADRYTTLFGIRPRHGRPQNRLGLPNSYLDRPLPQADPAALALCERQCVEVLTRRKAHVGVTGLVRDRLSRVSHGTPTMELIARDLHTTTRTLHRNLRREGTTFRSLDVGVRAQRAHDLLVETDLSIETIADRLGYATTSAFSNAFTRWRGVSPARFRRNQLAARLGSPPDKGVSRPGPTA